jgi:hypothetical protein
MSFNLTITVQPLPGAPALPVELSLTAAGQQHELTLGPAGDAWTARFELAAAPRYVRILGDCGEPSQPHCLDELVVLDSVASSQLHYTMVHDPQGPHLVRIGEPAPSLWLGFGWGLALLLAMGLLWWRGGRDAAG